MNFFARLVKETCERNYNHLQPSYTLPIYH